MVFENCGTQGIDKAMPFMACMAGSNTGRLKSKQMQGSRHWDNNSGVTSPNLVAGVLGGPGGVPRHRQRPFTPSHQFQLL